MSLNTHKNKEEAQLSVSVRKARQKAELLVIQPEFIDDINLLRKKWSVPPKGLVSIEDFDRWQRWFNKQNTKYQQIEYPKFRQQHKNDPDYASKIEYFSNQAPNNLFQRDLAELVKKYKLSPFWVQGLRGYLLRSAIPLPAGVIIEKSVDPTTQMPVLKLVLQEDTSIKDITAIWDQIKGYQKQFPYWRQEKSQPMPNFERNKEAYELKRAGKSYAEISELLDCGYNEVMDYVKTFKTYLQKNQIQ